MQSDVFSMTVFYDGACPLCRAEIRNLRWRNRRWRRIQFVDASRAGFVPPDGVSQAELMGLMHARLADGRWLKGVEVFERMYEAVGLDGVTKVLRVPVLRALAQRLYPVFARYRHDVPAWVAHVVFDRALGVAACRSVVRQSRAGGQRDCEGGGCQARRAS